MVKVFTDIFPLISNPRCSSKLAITRRFEGTSSSSDST